MKGGIARGCLLGWMISIMPLLAFAEQQAALSARCFGAAGDNCGVLTGYAQVGFCVGTRCPISGGTWEHDECCFEQTVKKRSGKSCVAPAPGMATGSGPAQVCNKEWVKSLQRTAGGWNWWRTVDTSILNADGKVVFKDYCAERGSRVHEDDVKYCCSKSAHRPDKPDVAEARICN